MRSASLGYQVERFGLVLVWLAVIAIFGAMRPDAFLTWSNFSSIFGSEAVLVIVTLGLIIPLTAGDFDLSIAQVLTFVSMLTAILSARLGMPIGYIIPIVLLAGALVGAVNGAITLYFRVHSLIVTLGVGTFLHGITLWMSDSQTISGVSRALMNYVIIYRIFGIPVSFYYAILLAAIVWYVLSYTAFRPAIAVYRAEQRGCALDRRRGRTRAHGCICRLGRDRRNRRDPIHRHDRLGEPEFRHNAAVACVCRSVSRRNLHQARTLQRLGCGCCGLLPRHRH
jgi:predicted ABC-type sugar transport system permease subunit